MWSFTIFNILHTQVPRMSTISQSHSNLLMRELLTKCLRLPPPPPPIKSNRNEDLLSDDVFNDLALLKETWSSNQQSQRVYTSSIKLAPSLHFVTSDLMEKNHNSWTSDFTSFAINSLLVRKNIGVSIDGRQRKNSPRLNEAPSWFRTSSSLYKLSVRDSTELGEEFHVCQAAWTLKKCYVFVWRTKSELFLSVAVISWTFSSSSSSSFVKQSSFRDVRRSLKHATQIWRMHVAL